MAAIDWSQLAHTIHEGVNTTVNAAGFLNKISHSHSQNATWGDLYKSAAIEDMFNASAERRQADLSMRNSMALFKGQNTMGPVYSVEGFKNAGINPALVGSYGGGSMPSGSFNASSVHAGSGVLGKIDKAQAFFSLASGLQALRESESRVQANHANARSLEARTATEDALRAFKANLTYYKSINESNAPLKLKAFLKGQAILNMVNAQRLMLMGSQMSVNASQAEANAARKKYLEELIKRDSRIGYNNSYINFNFGEVSKFFEKLIGGSGQAPSPDYVPFLGR